MSRKRAFSEMSQADKLVLDNLVSTLQAVALEVQLVDVDRIAIPFMPAVAIRQHLMKILTSISTDFLLDKSGAIVFKKDSTRFKLMKSASSRRAAERKDAVSLKPEVLECLPKEAHATCETIAFHVRRHLDLAAAPNMVIIPSGSNSYCLQTKGLQRVLASEALDLTQALSAFNPDISYWCDGDEIRVRVKIAI